MELAQDALKNIADFDPHVRAFITVAKDYALSRAREADAKIAQGANIGILTGIPFSAKDVFCVRGMKTTAGAKILQNYISPDLCHYVKQIMHHE